MISSSVKDVFSKGFSSIYENDTLSKCIGLFKEGVPPVLAVLDGKGKYKGVIARRWITRSRLDPALTKVRTLTRPAPRVALNVSLSEAAKLMIESGVRQLPVFEAETLVGFVTDENVIHGAVMEEWGNAKIEQIMTENPFVIQETESVGAVLSLLREKGISHVPVVNDGKLTGIISVQDVIEHVFQPKQRQTLGEVVGEKVPVLSISAKGIMTSPVITVLPENTLRYAEKIMHDFDISSLVVVSKARPVGIVTKLDFLEPIVGVKMPERELTIQFSIKDVGMDEIQRSLMIEDFDSFTRRYKKMLEAGTLFAYLKTHGTNHKGDQLIHCRLQLRTVKGSYFASGEGWGVEQTFRIALDRLEKQILKSKGFEHNPEYVKNYLRRIGFPLEEL